MTVDDFKEAAKTAMAGQPECNKWTFGGCVITLITLALCESFLQFRAPA